AVAVHESHLTAAHDLLDGVVRQHIVPLGLNPDDFELHGAEMKNVPKTKTKVGRKPSAWRGVPQSTRAQALVDAMTAVAQIKCGDGSHGCGLFGVALSSTFRPTDPTWQREQLAYEHLLKKFDDMIQRGGGVDLGLVVHDQRLVVESDIRQWTNDWRSAAGNIGRLQSFAHGPLFTDSKGVRLIQAADLVSYALYRQYSESNDPTYADLLWKSFDGVNGLLHGVVHLTPEFGRGTCKCMPCTKRRSH
ncbi:MAG TPA: DUF3800 domain-containing protein, partial [Nakamurella sp.]